MIMRGDGEKARPARWGVLETVGGLLLAVVLMRLLVHWLTSGGYYDGQLAFVLSYAVVWVPLLGACLIACFVTGTRSLRADFGLRITALDVLFGIGVGLLLRAFASVVEIAFYGRMSGMGVQFGEVVYDGWWVFGTLVAPIILAPFIEELFFRGLVQSATRRISERMPGALPLVVSTLVGATLFTALHLAETTNVTAAMVLGISTFALGVGAGLLAALTRRLGGSLVAHIVFNGSLIVTMLTA